MIPHSFEENRFSKIDLTPIRWFQVIVLLVIASLVIGATAKTAAPVRVGDGQEYYAMYLAVNTAHKPYMTESAWNAYDTFYRSHQVEGVVSDVKTMRNAFPQLRLPSGSDFNHFWMYSALAVVSHDIVGLAGWDAAPHTSFLIFHAFLLACVLIICYRGWRHAGVLSVLLLLLCSPMVWYADKVHTEFLTFLCGVAAVALLMQFRFVASAAWLALAATQNISLIGASLFVLGLGFLQQVIFSSFSWKSIFSYVAASIPVVFLAFLHPIYYYSRFHIITPQLLAGGADLGGVSLEKAFAFIFDPDIGLIPNWPIAVVFLAMGFVYRKNLSKNAWILVALFSLVYLLTNLYAQSATQNVNSGATIYISRYALWYICLFFPFTLLSVKYLFEIKLRFAYFTAAIFVFGLTVWNIVRYYPARYESYQVPTGLSEFLYSTIPSLFNPVPEIFYERYGNAGEEDSSKSSIILGPSCKKILVMGGNITDPVILGREMCGIDRDKLTSYVKSKGLISQKFEENYLILSETDRQRLRLVLQPGYLVTAHSDKHKLSDFLISGWSTVEDWGVWSDGDHASIRVPVKTCHNGIGLDLALSAFVGPGHTQVSMSASVNGKNIGSVVLKDGDAFPEIRSFKLSCSDLNQEQTFVLDLKIRGYIEPLKVVPSADNRNLGIGVISLKINEL